MKYRSVAKIMAAMALKVMSEKRISGVRQRKCWLRYRQAGEPAGTTGIEASVSKYQHLWHDIANVSVNWQ